MTSPRPRLWPLVALFGVLWLIAAVLSDGFLEDDAWTHFLYSTFSLVKPAFLLDVWGRPICTGLFALAAPWAGMAGCRVIGLILVLASVSLTIRTAKALRIDDRLAAVFLLGQPMLFLHSLSVMTELPFAVLLIAAFLACVRRRWWAMAVLVGLLPLARPEGFGFLLLGLAALVIHRRFVPMLVLALPLIAWSWLGWWMWGAPADEHWWLWLRDHWPYSASSSYGHGFILQFVALMPVLVGFGWPLVIVGVLSLSRYAGRGLGEGSAATAEAVSLGKEALTADSNPSRSEEESSPPPSPGVPGEGVSTSPIDRISLLLVAGIPLAMLVVHSLLWWAGKMASFGEIRYLLIAAPFWAMLAAVGWERSPIKPPPMKLAVAGLIVVFVCKVTFLRSSAEADTARQVRDWYAFNQDVKSQHPRVVASHPAVYVYLNISPDDAAHYGSWSPATLQHPADNTIVIWDPKCGPFNADNRLVADVAGLQALGWKTIETFPGGWVAMVKADHRSP